MSDFERNATAAEHRLHREARIAVSRFATMGIGMSAVRLDDAERQWRAEIAARQPAPPPEPPARSISHWGMFVDAP